MQKDWLMEEFDHAREQGISVSVKGVPYEECPAQEVWEMMPKGNYMLDYEGDATGKIIALHVDIVEPLERPKKSDVNKKVGKCRNIKS